MSLFDLFRGKEKPKESRLIELKLDEAQEFIQEKLSSRFESLEKESLSGVAEIKHFLKEIERELSELQKLNIEQEEGNTRLRRIASTSKADLLKRMDSLSKKISPPSTTDLLELKEYFSHSALLLDQEISSFGKSIAYTSLILKEPVKKMGATVEELRKKIHSLKQLLDSSPELSLLPETKTRITELQGKLNDFYRKSSYSTKKEISVLKEDLETSQVQLKHFINSPGSVQLNKFLQEKADLAQKKQQLKTKIMELFAPLDKPLKRFSKLVESNQFSLEKEEKHLLQQYLSNPLLALKADPKAEYLKKFLNYLKQLIQKDKISLKEKEKEKKLSSLQELLSFDFFENVFWEFNSLEKEAAEIEKNIKSLDISSNIDALNAKVKSLEKEIQEKTLLLAQEEKIKENLSKEIDSLKDILEAKIQKLLGSPILIKTPFNAPEKKEKEN